MSSIPAQTVVVELEQVLIDCLNANLIAPKPNENNKHLLVLNNETLIICGLSLSQVIESMRRLNVDRFEKIVVYIFDAFLGENIRNVSQWKTKFSRFYRTLEKIDYLFVPFYESVSDFKERFSINTFYLPMASDVLKFGSRNINRPIDINGYGRQNKKHSDIFSCYFNEKNNGIYFHTDHFSISKINNFTAHRNYFWNLLRRSKIALAYDPVRVDPKNRFPFSFVAQRWFESLSAGCVILGNRPTSDDADKLLS